MFKKPDSYRDSKGAYYTQSLFHEWSDFSNTVSIFTTGDKDREYKGRYLWSFKRLYLELGDVTEYEFANTYLEGWGHFKRLQSNKAFRELLEDCRHELELKIRSRAINTMIAISNGDGKDAAAAARWIATKGWESHGRGRPSNTEKAKALAIETQLRDEVSDDAARISLVVNNRK